jgi:hypothetical protein
MPDPAVEPSSVAERVPAAAPTPRAPASPWIPALTAALLAGVASWLVGEAFLNHFKPSEKAASEPYNFGPLNREMRIANSYNGAIAFGALGGLLGLGLGAAGGLSRRSARHALAGALTGLVLGGAAGAAPSFGIMPWHWDHRNDDPSSSDLTVPLMLHLGLWCGLGTAAGLAYGLGRGGARPAPLVRGAVGGLIGAAVGTALFELVGAAALPMDLTTSPIAESTLARLLARLFIAVFAALGAVVALQPGKPADRPA